MSVDTPNSALVFCFWGQNVACDEMALAQMQADDAGLSLFVMCLEGVDPPDLPGLHRIVRLPLDRSHVAHAEAIGLQLCLNEGARRAGVVRALAAEDIAAASRHLSLLASGGGDAVIVPGSGPTQAHLFLSARAAFLASSWLALGGELASERERVAAALLALTRRRGFIASGPEYRPLAPANAAEFASFAELLRQRLGLFIGDRRPRTAKPVRRIAVVTPYYKEPDSEIRRMMESVAKQTAACHHIVVSDGFPNPLACQPGVTHIELGRAHGDNGNTPRYVGALVALAQGYDAVAFLDADNWFEPRHIERLLARQKETGASAVFSMRNIYLPDGTKVAGVDGEDASRNHVDTSCMLITADCEYALHLWGQMPPEWGPLCDRVVFAELAGQRLAWTTNRTMNFQSNYAHVYQAANRPVPDTIHSVPLSLIEDFEQLRPEFRDRAVSRVGRVIRLIGV